MERCDVLLLQPETMSDPSVEPLHTAELVVIDYTTLTEPFASSVNLSEQIAKAFGSEGVGIIGVRNVPGFQNAKKHLLSLAYPLAHLPPVELQKLEDPESLYNAGWSHGKEKLKANLPDLNKASFYYNPLIDVPGTEEERRLYPLSYPCNKWPSAGANLPSLEPTAKRLGCLMKDVAVLLASHIDAYANSLNVSYEPHTLLNALADTEKVKGRLLYYYPLSHGQNDLSEDSWIGWHNDSGFLTCLAGDIYFTPDGTPLPQSPTPAAGLYVVDRQDRVCKIEIPADCMAVQIGECTQILTGGAVIATPHCVKGAPGVGRASLACFIDTPPTYVLSSPVEVEKEERGSRQFEKTIAAKSSSRVPPLAKRWKDGMTFGDFLEKTFKMYYDIDP